MFATSFEDFEKEEWRWDRLNDSKSRSVSSGMLKASASHPVISPCIDASSSKLKPKGESVQGGWV